MAVQGEAAADEVTRRANIINAQYGGVFGPFRAFYVHSILHSADRCCEAFLRYDAALLSTTDAAAVVSTVHEALSHAAALSRFFWPSWSKQGVAEKRGQTLREMFHVSENSPLRDRSLRDGLEHFDERLDRYLLDDRVGQFFPGAIVGDHALADDASVHLCKLVDPDASCFVLLGEKHFFGALRPEVSRIRQRASEKA